MKTLFECSHSRVFTKSIWWALNYPRFLLLILLVMPLSPASASYIVEMSKTLEFSDAALGSDGTVAYIAESADDPDSYRAIHRNGGPWIVEGVTYEEISDILVVTNTGVVMFGAIHGEFAFPATNPNDPPLRQQVGGVYRGPSPAIPDKAGGESVRGDNVLAQANGQEGIPMGFSSDGKLLFDDTVRFPGPVDCPGNGINPDRPREYLRSVRFNTLIRGGAQDINSLFAAGFTGSLTEGSWIGMSRYFRCGEQDDFSELKNSTLDYFYSVGSLKIGEGGTITLIGRRNVQAGAGPAGVYSVSPAGAISVLREWSPGEDFAPIGVTKTGEYFYLDSLPDGTRGTFFSGNPDFPLIASGHQLGNYVVNCGADGVADNGSIVCTGEVCDIFDEDDCYNAVIVADGGTDFPPDPDAPPDPDVVRWINSDGGEFLDAENWNPNVVPDSDITTVFEISTPAITPITFGTTIANARQLEVKIGLITFLGGGLQLNQGSLASPSLYFDTSQTNPNVFIITDGHQLQTNYAEISGQLLPNEFSEVLISDDLNLEDPQTRWDNHGRLTVDSKLKIEWSGGLITDSLRVGSEPGSEGQVIVEIPDSQGTCPQLSIADFGEASIGYRGKGTLEILGPCIVEARADRVIGALPGSEGIVNISGAWTQFLSSATDTFMRIGSAGKGTVNLTGGLGAEFLYIGQSETGDGTLNVSGPSAFADVSEFLVVGLNGKGHLTVDNGGSVRSATLDVGNTSGTSQGYAMISHPPNLGIATLDVQGGISVGGPGTGEAIFTEQATIRSDWGRIGEGPGGRGKVTIQREARWDLQDFLDVGFAGAGVDPEVCDDDDVGISVGELALTGDGQVPAITGDTLTVTGPDSKVTGTGRVFANTVLRNCGQISPGNSPGTLVLEGNLDSRGGVLVIELFGLADGEFDVLEITGGATLSGGIVRFIFRSFVPQKGDQITFLETGGGLTLGDNMRYEYQGANEGFEFDISADGDGSITFTALNDAVDELFSDGFE